MRMNNIHSISPKGTGGITHSTTIRRMIEAGSLRPFSLNKHHSINAGLHPVRNYLVADSVKR
jgi:hypothetical protein